MDFGGLPPEALFLSESRPTFANATVGTLRANYERRVAEGESAQLTSSQVSGNLQNDHFLS